MVQRGFATRKKIPAKARISRAAGVSLPNAAMNAIPYTRVVMIRQMATPVSPPRIFERASLKLLCMFSQSFNPYGQKELAAPRNIKPLWNSFDTFPDQKVTNFSDAEFIQ